MVVNRGGDRGWQAGAGAPARKLFFQLIYMILVKIITQLKSCPP